MERSFRGASRSSRPRGSVPAHAATAALKSSGTWRSPRRRGSDGDAEPRAGSTARERRSASSTRPKASWKVCRRPILLRAGVDKVFGHVRRYQGEYAAALAHYKRALDVQQATWGKEDPRLGNLLNGIGRTLMAAGNVTEAVATLEEAARLVRSLDIEYHPELAVILNNLGVAYRDAGRMADAKRTLEQAHAIYLRVLPPENPERADVLVNLGSVLRMSGEFARASAAYEEVLRLAQNAPGGGKGALTHAYNNLGNLYLETGRLEEALATHRKALELRLDILGASHPETAFSYLNIGRVLARIGQPEAGLVEMRRAESVFRQRFATSTRTSGLSCTRWVKWRPATAGRTRPCVCSSPPWPSSRVASRHDHPELSDVTTSLGRAYIALAKTDAAVQILERGVAA